MNGLWFYTKTSLNIAVKIVFEVANLKKLVFLLYLYVIKGECTSNYVFV